MIPVLVFSFDVAKFWENQINDMQRYRFKNSTGEKCVGTSHEGLLPSTSKECSVDNPRTERGQ